MLVALTSARSCGVTTTALAAALTWPRPVVLAEADPAGGTIQAGYLAGRLPADRGIGELAVALLRGDEPAASWSGQLIDLQPPHQRRLLLPGVTDPVQAGALGPVWDRLATWFTDLAHTPPPYDVIADCGRLAVPHTPWPLLQRADAVLLVLPATLAGISAAMPAVRALRTGLADHRPGTLGLLLCGRGDQSARTVAAALGCPVVCAVPHDPRAARTLSRGGTIRGSEALLRSAAGACQHIAAHIGRHTPPAPSLAPQGSPLIYAPGGKT